MALVRAAAGPARLVGDRVAVAVGEVLGVDGVWLAAAGGVRWAASAVPVGASSASASLVERLEFTVGQGPCIQVHRDGRMVIASGAVLARRWPVFHDVFVTQTPFRSVVGLPLPGPLSSMLTVGLLLRDDQGADRLDLSGIAAVGVLVTAALIEADLHAQADAAKGSGGSVGAFHDDGWDGPVWLSGPGAVGRHGVMVAAGMISWELKIPVGDAVKVLKGRAYGQHSTADEVAAAIVTGVVPVTALTVDD